MRILASDAMNSRLMQRENRGILIKRLAHTFNVFRFDFFSTLIFLRHLNKKISQIFFLMLVYIEYLRVMTCVHDLFNFSFENNSSLFGSFSFSERSDPNADKLAPICPWILAKNWSFLTSFVGRDVFISSFKSSDFKVLQFVGVLYFWTNSFPFSTDIPPSYGYFLIYVRTFSIFNVRVFF